MKMTVTSPLKTKMFPENQWLEDVMSFEHALFSWKHRSFVSGIRKTVTTQVAEIYGSSITGSVGITTKPRFEALKTTGMVLQLCNGVFLVPRGNEQI